MELDTLSPPLLFTRAGAQLAGTCMFILLEGYVTNEQTLTTVILVCMHAKH